MYILHYDHKNNHTGSLRERYDIFYIIEVDNLTYYTGMITHMLLLYVMGITYHCRLTLTMTSSFCCLFRNWPEGVVFDTKFLQNLEHDEFVLGLEIYETKKLSYSWSHVMQCKGLHYHKQCIYYMVLFRRVSRNTSATNLCQCRLTAVL